MEPEQTPNEQPVSRFKNLHKVTPLSKYLAMTLFVALPFLGCWIGYTYAPEKVVEVEKIIESTEMQTSHQNSEIDELDRSAERENGSDVSRTLNILEDYKLVTYWCGHPSEVDRTCSKLLGKVEGSEDFEVLKELPHQYEYKGVSAKDSKIFFESYTPESDSGRYMVELNLENLSESIGNYYASYKGDLLLPYNHRFVDRENRGRILVARATSSGKAVEIFDVVNESVTYTVNLEEETLFSECSPLGAGFYPTQFAYVEGSDDLLFAVYDAGQPTPSRYCGDNSDEYLKFVRYGVISDVYAR